MGEDAESWAERRLRTATAHAAAYERDRAGEAERARELVADFARQAYATGLRLTSLTAQAYQGRARYRTGLRGWYIHRNLLYAVGGDGEFYLLTARGGPLARLTGVELAPDTPRLVLGEGGRDGEAVRLEVLLAKRLAAGDRWP